MVLSLTCQTVENYFLMILSLFNKRMFLFIYLFCGKGNSIEEIGS